MRRTFKFSLLNLLVLATLAAIIIFVSCSRQVSESASRDSSKKDMKKSLSELVEAQRIFAERYGTFSRSLTELEDVITIFVGSDVTMYITFVDGKTGWRGLAENKMTGVTCEIEVGSAVQANHKPGEPYC